MMQQMDRRPLDWIIGDHFNKLSETIWSNHRRTICRRPLWL